MLNILSRAPTTLVSLADRMVAPLRAARDWRAERAILTRLAVMDDHLLHDIGLTAQDVLDLRDGKAKGPATARRHAVTPTAPRWPLWPLAALSPR
jgi:uncharacterized protein YjiS (DUF1127 family)